MKCENLPILKKVYKILVIKMVELISICPQLMLLSDISYIGIRDKLED